jgi:hypothetical protein
MLTCGKKTTLIYSLLIDLYNYAEFFEKILYKTCKVFIKDMVCVMEQRHIFGVVFDEAGPIGMERELAIFERVLNKIRARYPLFQCKLVVCGLKMLGMEHIVKMIKATQESSLLTGIIAGFDMVCEEDYTDPIIKFA